MIKIQNHKLASTPDRIGWAVFARNNDVYSKTRPFFRRKQDVMLASIYLFTNDEDA